MSGPSLPVLVMVLLFPASILGKDEEVWSVTGVAGRSSDLPCYLNPRTPGDSPKLILWYKESVRTPLISHDTRAPLQGRIQQGEGVLTLTKGAATLTYHRVKPQDAGVYECRVDFYSSPAHSNFVNLSVVELPKSVQILDRQTGPAKNGILGPYFTGQTVLISCISLDGSPLPNLTWWKNNHIVNSEWEVTGPGQVQSDLVIEKVTREWHNQTLTCTASNTHLASPVAVSVLVQLYLLPRSVVIRNPGPVREGQQIQLLCTAEGSRPPPTILWRIRGRTIHAHKTEEEGLVKVSRLLVNMSRADDNSLVMCTAENPAVPGSAINNTTVLAVHYPPTVSVSLGRSLNPRLLKEGDDVYFTCTVAANPPASAITWYHEGTIQVQNMTSGVILSGDSLVLQKVSRRRAGHYKCSASNELATVVSAPVHLRIRYKPECLTSPTTYFIYDKPINVTCTVTSHPSVSAIHWQWNSSNDVIKTQLISQSAETISTQLTVYPIETYEDRLLSCWAVNEMGRQPLACGFSIKVAEMPQPLSSCRLANITASSLSLTCQRPALATAGTTLYRAEVYFDNLTLFANVTSLRPNFNVSRLDPGTSYQIKVYVSHGPVTSEPVLVSAYTSRTGPDKKADPGQRGVEEGPIGASPPGEAVVVTGDESGGEVITSDSGGAVGGGAHGEGVGALVGVSAFALLFVLGVVWACRRCSSSCGRGRGKSAHFATTEDSNNPDVVPSIGTSFPAKRSVSPQRFWHKEKAYAHPVGATGAAEDAGAGEPSSSSGADAATARSPSPADSPKPAAPTGSPGPAGSPRSPDCAAGRSPSGGQRTLGVSPTEGRRSPESPKDSFGAKEDVGLKDSSPVVEDWSPGDGVGGRRPASASVATRTPSSGGPATNPRPVGALVNPLRQSVVLPGEEYPGVWKKDGGLLPRERVSYPSGGPKRSPRDDRYPGVRFSLPPREGQVYEEAMSPESPTDNGYYSGLRLKYKTKELENSPGLGPQQSPREGVDYLGCRGQRSPREEEIYAPVRPQKSPRDEEVYAPIRPQDSPREEEVYGPIRPQNSPRDERDYTPVLRGSSPDEEDSYPGIQPRVSPRGRRTYPANRPLRRGTREIHRYIGVRVQHSPRGLPSLTNPEGRVQPPSRDVGTYPGVRGRGGPRRQEQHKRIVSKTGLHCPVDQLMKAAETVV